MLWSSRAIRWWYLNVTKTADWIIDLGPEGGVKGGEIVAEGTPEEVVKVERSFTAKYLAPSLRGKDGKVAGKRAAAAE
jgi:excinuclease ABC subunit A